jgi:uncharacterized surface protein with fasciclin (FAS1) repeats
MKNLVWRMLKWSSKMILVALLLYSCDSTVHELPAKSTDLVIADYITSRSDLSELANIMKRIPTENSLLAVRGPFTVFLPTNDAMNAYYVDKGISSSAGLSDSIWAVFVRNLLVPSYLETGSFGYGALANQNAIGDFLVTEFSGSDIYVNKESKIVNRNIPAANGVIHIIDKALDPLSNTVYQELASNPSYSIFTAALDKSGLTNTLNQINYQYGPDKFARTRFTILAIADTTFNRFGINNVNELVAMYTDDLDNLTSLDNGFYRYMEYHCLGGTYYLNDFVTQNYPVLSYDNNLSFIVDDEYRINQTGTEYTSIIILESNIPAKNGAIHTVTGLLPVSSPRPSKFTWEVTEHVDLMQGDYFRKNYKKFFDGENDFAGIKWTGDYLLYYYKPGSGLTPDPLFADCLAMTGWWTIEVTTPKIMKGKYDITGLNAPRNSYDIYIDGVNTSNYILGVDVQTKSWGIVNWDTTTTHKIKLVATDPGGLFWDGIIFTPVN